MKKILMTMMLLSVTLSLLAACGNKPKAAEPAVSAEEQATEVVAETAVDLAPDFELPALQGNTLKLSSLRGKYVVLDFWGSWCICMKQAYAKHKDNMEILGIDCRDTEEKWKAAVEKYELPWLQVRCSDAALQTIGQQYHLEGFPTKVVIDPEGKLVKVVVGEDPQFYTFLDELFAK